MRELNDAVEEARVSERGLSLWHILIVASAVGFVAILILTSGQLAPSWLLFLAPITLAALVADVPGGILVTVACAGATVLVAPREALTDQWPQLLTGFSVFLGCAIVVGGQAHRQRSHAEALERVSTQDQLTGVRKSRSFLARLAEEMRRSDRYGTDLGVVVARVMNVEEFTRTFGRYKTDLMLKHLADVMRLEVRDTDSIGRIDHSTFAIALPHSGAADTARVSERIAAMVAATEFEGDALEPVTRCTVTVASASYPEDAGDAPSLMTTLAGRLADDASGASATVTMETASAAGAVS